MTVPYTRKPKDKKVRIFIEQGDGIKHYIHPETGPDGVPYYINAYVRQLSANEQASANATQDRSSLEFVINKRKIAVDNFIEFDGKTYQVDAVDNFEFYQTEVKLRAYEVSQRTYSGIEWGT